MPNPTACDCGVWIKEYIAQSGSVHFAHLERLHAARCHIANHEHVDARGHDREIKRFVAAAIDRDALRGDRDLLAEHVAKRELQVQRLRGGDAQIQQIAHRIGKNGEGRGIKSICNSDQGRAALLKALRDDEAAGSEALDHHFADGLGDLHPCRGDGVGAARGDDLALDALGHHKARDEQGEH